MSSFKISAADWQGSGELYGSWEMQVTARR
jgi:hypothetical protein